MKIRSPLEDELSTIAELMIETQNAHVKAYPERYRILSPDDAMSLIQACCQTQGLKVAVVDNTVLGYAVFEVIQVPGNKVLKERTYCYLQQIGVVRGAQNKGVGSALVNHVFEYCKEKKVLDIELDVWAFNVKAKVFFERHGFEPYASKLRHVIKV